MSGGGQKQRLINTSKRFDMTIHWCGTGLSAVPGLRRLIEAKKDVCVWNRTVEKATEAVGDITDNIHAFDITAVGNVLAKGDVVIHAAGDWHGPAELAMSGRILYPPPISLPKCLHWMHAPKRQVLPCQRSWP